MKKYARTTMPNSTQIIRLRWPNAWYQKLGWPASLGGMWFRKWRFTSGMYGTPVPGVPFSP